MQSVGDKMAMAPHVSAPNTERIQIFEIGSGNFALFDGIDRIRHEFRLLCSSIHHPKGEDSSANVDEFATRPAMLLPEQAQILFENGFAQIRRISDAGEGCSDALLTTPFPLDTTDKNEESEERFRALARQVVIGRKIKARKRAMLDVAAGGGGCSASALKVRKLDIRKGEDEGIQDGCSPEELDDAVAELIGREVERKRLKLASTTNDDDGGTPLPPHQQHTHLAYVSTACPSSSCPIVREPTFPNTNAYGVRLKVFRDLWRKGFYLASGAKFGCDYLAYEKPPPAQHSTFMILCMDVNDTCQQQLRPLSLISVCRAGTQVKKRVLLAFASSGSVVPYYLEMNWWKGDGN